MGRDYVSLGFQYSRPYCSRFTDFAVEFQVPSYSHILLVELFPVTGAKGLLKFTSGCEAMKSKIAAFKLPGLEIQLKVYRRGPTKASLQTDN